MPAGSNGPEHHEAGLKTDEYILIFNLSSLITFPAFRRQFDSYILFQNAPDKQSDKKEGTALKFFMNVLDNGTPTQGTANCDRSMSAGYLYADGNTYSLNQQEHCHVSNHHNEHTHKSASDV